MDEQELQALKVTFEEAGIRFVRENQPGVGLRIGVILATTVDHHGNNWIAIADGNVSDDDREPLRRVLDWVASMGY